jgi:hypothetical protein
VRLRAPTAAAEAALVDWRLHAFGAHVRRSQGGGGGRAPGLTALHHSALDNARRAVEGWREQAVVDPQRRCLWLWVAAAAASAGGSLRRRAIPVARWRSVMLGLMGHRSRLRLCLACWRLAARHRSLLAAAGRVALARGIENGPGSPVAAAIVSRSGYPARAGGSLLSTPPTARACGADPASSSRLPPQRPPCSAAPAAHPFTPCASRGASCVHSSVNGGVHSSLNDTACIHSSMNGRGGEWPPARAAALGGHGRAGVGPASAEGGSSSAEGAVLDIGGGLPNGEGRALHSFEGGAQDDRGSLDYTERGSLEYTEGGLLDYTAGGSPVGLRAHLLHSWQQRDTHRLLLRWRSKARSRWFLLSGLRLASDRVRRERLRAATGAWAAAAFCLSASASVETAGRLTAAARAAVRRRRAWHIWALEHRRGRRASHLASTASSVALCRRGYTALRRNARHEAAAAVGAQLFVSGRWVGRSVRSGVERWREWGRRDAAGVRLTSRGMMHCAVRAARAEAVAMARMRAHAAARRHAAAACEAWRLRGALIAWHQRTSLYTRLAHLHALCCFRTLGRRVTARRRQRHILALASAAARASMLVGGWGALTMAGAEARAARIGRAAAERRARRAAIRRWAAAPRLRVLRMLMVARGRQRYGCAWVRGGKGGAHRTVAQHIRPEAARGAHPMASIGVIPSGLSLAAAGDSLLPHPSARSPLAPPSAHCKPQLTSFLLSPHPRLALLQLQQLPRLAVLRRSLRHLATATHPPAPASTATSLALTRTHVIAAAAAPAFHLWAAAAVPLEHMRACRAFRTAHARRTAWNRLRTRAQHEGYLHTRAAVAAVSGIRRRRREAWAWMLSRWPRSVPASDCLCRTLRRALRRLACAAAGTSRARELAAAANGAAAAAFRGSALRGAVSVWRAHACVSHEAHGMAAATFCGSALRHAVGQWRACACASHVWHGAGARACTAATRRGLSRLGAAAAEARRSASMVGAAWLHGRRGELRRAVRRWAAHHARHATILEPLAAHASAARRASECLHACMSLIHRRRARHATCVHARHKARAAACRRWHLQAHLWAVEAQAAERAAERNRHTQLGVASDALWRHARLSLATLALLGRRPGLQRRAALRAWHARTAAPAALLRGVMRRRALWVWHRHANRNVATGSAITAVQHRLSPYTSAWRAWNRQCALMKAVAALTAAADTHACRPAHPLWRWRQNTARRKTRLRGLAAAVARAWLASPAHRAFDAWRAAAAAATMVAAMDQAAQAAAARAAKNKLGAVMSVVLAYAMRRRRAEHASRALALRRVSGLLARTRVRMGEARARRDAAGEVAHRLLVREAARRTHSQIALPIAMRAAAAHVGSATGGWALRRMGSPLLLRRRLWPAASAPPMSDPASTPHAAVTLSPPHLQGTAHAADTPHLPTLHTVSGPTCSAVHPPAGQPTASTFRLHESIPPAATPCDSHIEPISTPLLSSLAQPSAPSLGRPVPPSTRASASPLLWVVGAAWRAGGEARRALGVWHYRAGLTLRTRAARLAAVLLLRRFAAAVGRARHSVARRELSGRFRAVADYRAAANAFSALAAAASAAAVARKDTGRAAALRRRHHGRALLRRLARGRDCGARLCAASTAVAAARSRDRRAAALGRWRCRRLSVPAYRLPPLCARARLSTALCILAAVALERRAWDVKGQAASVLWARAAASAAVNTWRHHALPWRLSLSVATAVAARRHPRMRLNALRRWQGCAPALAARTAAAACARRRCLLRSMLALRAVEAGGWARRYRQLATRRLVRVRWERRLGDAIPRWRAWAAACAAVAAATDAGRVRRAWGQWARQVVPRTLQEAWGMGPWRTTIPREAASRAGTRPRERLAAHIAAFAGRRMVSAWRAAAAAGVVAGKHRAIAEALHRRIVSARALDGICAQMSARRRGMAAAGALRGHRTSAALRSWRAASVGRHRVRAQAVSAAAQRLAGAVGGWRRAAAAAAARDTAVARMERTRTALGRWRRAAAVRGWLRCLGARWTSAADGGRVRALRSAVQRWAADVRGGAGRRLREALAMRAVSATAAALHCLHLAARLAASRRAAIAAFQLRVSKPAALRRAAYVWALRASGGAVRWRVPLARVLHRRRAGARAVRCLASNAASARLAAHAAAARAAAQARRAFASLRLCATRACLAKRLLLAAEEARRLLGLCQAWRALRSHAGHRTLQRHAGERLGGLAASSCHRLARRHAMDAWGLAAIARTSTTAREEAIQHRRRRRAAAAAVGRLSEWASAARRHRFCTDVARKHARLGALLTAYVTLGASARAAGRTRRLRCQLSRHVARAATARAMVALRAAAAPRRAHHRMEMAASRAAAAAAAASLWESFLAWSESAMARRAAAAVVFRCAQTALRAALWGWRRRAGVGHMSVRRHAAATKRWRYHALQGAVVTLHSHSRRAAAAAVLGFRLDLRRLALLTLRDCARRMPAQVAAASASRSRLASRYWVHRATLLAVARLRRHALVASLLEGAHAPAALLAWRAAGGRGERSERVPLSAPGADQGHLPWAVPLPVLGGTPGALTEAWGAAAGGMCAA